MKHYCLKPKAKTQMIETLTAISFAIVLVLFVVSIVTLPLSFIIAPNSIAELILSYIGILSWTALLSVIAIDIKRWLQSNIVEC